MKLKKLYSSREVSSLTGLSTRQLQWWDARRLLRPSVTAHPTERGGFTERRYSSIELIELMVLADLRRRGFTIARIKRLLDILGTHFHVRLFDAIEGGGPLTLFIDGQQIFARTEQAEIYNVLENPVQPLLMLGEHVKLRQLAARESKRPARRRTSDKTRTPSRRSPNR